MINEAIFYTLILAASMCFCLGHIHGRLQKIWLAIDDLYERKLDAEP